MGQPNSKPGDKLSHINREVTSLRSSVRSNRKFTVENKDKIIQELVQCSNEVNALKGKVKTRQLEQVQSNISHAMEDILSKNPQEQDLDMGAVETSSFVQLSVSKRQMSNKDLSDSPAKRPKNTQADFGKASIPTLVDIEEKLKVLKPQISVAIEQRDLTQLRVHQQTIKVLATDLEMIEVKEYTPLDDRKKKLDKSIVAQHQKITKIMKDIRRDKDLNYLAKQNTRSLKQLEDIQKEISEIDSSLQTLIKNSDQSSVNSLRENVHIIRQRLGSAETVDETTKEMQLKLLKKLTDISKTIDDYMQGSGHSDLTKAKMNYEEIIRNIASGNSIDKDEIKIKLESLQSFINSIKDDNETTLRGKQQLLNNVRQSFSFILENEHKIENTEQELDNKEEIKPLKELEDFYGNWKALQKSINLISSLNDFSEVDKVLSDIQKSIEETRLQLAESTSLPPNLNKKFTYSTPNLSSPKPMHSKFGSSLSVDQSNNSLIRTRVKVYNISTPQVQNINSQPVVLRNRKFYQNSTSPNDNRPFSKIEEIKTQVNYIKEKFPESQQKQHLKNKLESYMEVINGYTHHQNQRVADSAKTQLTDIEEMLKNMSHIPDAMNDTSQRRASIELSFENVVGLQDNVEQLEAAVAKFEGKKGDPQYKKIVGDLSECRKYLRSIDIPPKYDMINQQREEILNKIAVIFNALESKCFNYEDPRLAITKDKLNSLKGKVNRFSGAYKGVLYNQIEKDLNKLLVDVTASVNDQHFADDITKDVEKHLKILEHRATKDQSFRRTLSDIQSKREGEEKLMKLKIDLLNIKTATDITPATAEDQFLQLNSRLDLVKLGLDQLKLTLEEEEKQRDILYNEVETLKHEVEAKISLARETVKQLSMQQEKEKMELEELKKIEERFKHIKPEIESFVGTTSDNKFYELDENSIRLILKMDKLQFVRGSEAHKKKLDLLKEIYNYGDLLDQRAKESEDILDTERSLHDIEKNFARNLKLNDLETLKEKATALKTKLDSTQYNNNLLQRKQACIEGIEALFEKIAANEGSTNGNFDRVNAEIVQGQFLTDIELAFGNIKKEIDHFYGSLSHSKYYEINTSLTALFFKLDSLQLAQDSGLRPRKIVLLKEMHSYKEILYNKAKDIEAVQEIDSQLTSINKMVDNYKGKDEELRAMENELNSIKARMKSMKIGEERRRPLDEKLKILLEECARFKKAKATPKDYIGSTSFFKDVENNLNKNKLSPQLQGITSARLAEIENEIGLVRKNAATFTNSETSEEYKIIEDTLLRLKMRLNKVPSEYIAQQHQLEKAIDECFNMLDDRCADVASVMEIEKALDTIDEKLRGTVSEGDKSLVDEKLIYLQVKLGKLRVNEGLLERKNQCADRINKYLKLVKDNNWNKPN